MFLAYACLQVLSLWFSDDIWNVGSVVYVGV